MLIRRILLILLFCLSSFALKAQSLLIFGGVDHDVFLGVLNASNMDSSSIWNAYGNYGNIYNATSIWNSYGTYGSEYSSTSPFNSYASNPPVVVDRSGNFYGYLTLNTSKKQCQHPIALAIYKYYKLIRKDVSEGYKAIFGN